MFLPKSLLSLLLLGSLNASAQNCTTVHEGKFKVPGDENNPKTSYVTRTGEYQYEEVPSIGFKMRCTVKWTSDCSYELSDAKILKGKGGDWPKDLVVYVTIKDVTDKSYIAYIHSNYSEATLEKEIFIEPSR